MSHQCLVNNGSRVRILKTIIGKTFLTINLPISNYSIEELKVYNLCSTTIRPVDNYTMLADGERIMRSCPSLYVIRPPRLPPKTNNMSNLEYKIKIFYSHVIFAFIIDLLLFIFRQPPM